MSRRPLLTVLSCLILALNACEGGGVESSPNTNLTNMTPTGTPPPRDDAASSQSEPGDAAATSAPQGEASTVTSRPQAVAQVRWRNNELVPASAPVTVGNALVLYTIDGQRLQITGVDQRDGEVLWSRAASASVRPRGQNLQVEPVDGLVAHLAPVASGPETEGAPAHVILRDPVTGEEVHRSRAALSHADLPAPCPHDDTWPASRSRSTVSGLCRR